jgi:hypothetical protein
MQAERVEQGGPRRDAHLVLDAIDVERDRHSGGRGKSFGLFASRW